MPFAATWMDLEIVILRKIHQTENYKYHMMLFMHRTLKNGKMNLFKSRNKVTDVENKLLVTGGKQDGGE